MRNKAGTTASKAGTMSGEMNRPSRDGREDGPMMEVGGGEMERMVQQ